MVKGMLAEDASLLSAQNEWGMTLLHRAARSGKFAIVQHFLSLGFDVNIRDRQRNTPLIFAVESSGWASIAIAKLLVDRGANVNAKNSHGSTALIESIRYADLGCFAYLLGAGADPTMRDRRRMGPMEMAGFSINDGMPGRKYDPQRCRVQTMIAVLNDLDSVAKEATSGQIAPVRNPSTQTPTRAAKGARLFKMVEGGKYDSLLAELSRAPDLAYVRDKYQRTLLHVATSCGNLKMVQMLLGLGLDPNARRSQRFTTMHEVPRSKRPSDLAIAKLLLEHGAKIEALTTSWETPLLLAAEYGNLLVFGYLLGCGANILAKNRSKMDSAQIADWATDELPPRSYFTAKAVALTFVQHTVSPFVGDVAPGEQE